MSMDSVNPTLREVLKQAILQARERGVAQKRISLETGVPESSISMLVNGHKGVGHDYIMALCRYLKINPESGKSVDNSEGSDIPRNIKARLKFRVSSREPAMFTEVPQEPIPILPDEIDINEHEYNMIIAMRGDPRQGFEAALSQLKITQSNLPLGDTVTRAEAMAAIAMLEGIIKAQHDRSGRRKHKL